NRQSVVVSFDPFDQAHPALTRALPLYLLMLMLLIGGGGGGGIAAWVRPGQGGRAARGGGWARPAPPAGGGAPHPRPGHNGGRAPTTGRGCAAADDPAARRLAARIFLLISKDCGGETKRRGRCRTAP